MTDEERSQIAADILEHVENSRPFSQDYDRGRIFVITLFRDGFFPKEKMHRSWAWYLNFQDAEEHMLNNYCNIFDNGYYDIGLIEEFGEGIPLANTKRRWWYKAWYDSVHEHILVERYVEPEWAAGIINFAIG